MKRYLIKPEYIDLFGSDCNAYTIINEYDLICWQKDFNKSIDDILSMLIEYKESCYSVLYRFPHYGKNPLTREYLNELIRFESGNPDDFFETNNDYNQAIKDGFVKSDCYYVTIYIDE